MFALLFIMALIGFAAWFLVRYIKMPPPISTIIVIVASVFIILLFLKAIGALPHHDIAVPQL